MSDQESQEDEDETTRGMFYRFTEGDGETIIDGKSHWSDYVTVTMDRYGAFQVAKNLLEQLSQESRTKFVLYFAGKLEVREDDDDE